MIHTEYTQTHTMKHKYVTKEVIRELTIAGQQLSSIFILAYANA